MDALCPETPGKFSKCILQRGVGRDNLVNVTPQRASLCTGSDNSSKGNLTYNPAPLLVFYLLKVMSTN